MKGAKQKRLVELFVLVETRQLVLISLMHYNDSQLGELNQFKRRACFRFSPVFGLIEKKFCGLPAVMR